MPGPAESPTPPPSEVNAEPAHESPTSTGSKQEGSGHETAAQLQGDFADAKKQGDKTPAGSTLRKLARRAYAGAKSFIGKRSNTTPAADGEPSTQDASSTPDSPADSGSNPTTPELKTVITPDTGTDTADSPTVHPGQDATDQEKKVLESVTPYDVKGGDAPDNTSAQTGTETGGQNQQADENTEDEDATDTDDDGKENGEPEKNPEQRIQDAKDKLTSLNPYINFDNPEMQKLLDEALTDPDKLAKFESIVEKTNERVQSVIEIAEKQLTSTDIANLTSHELTSLLETLKAVEPSVKADSAEGKRLHWAILVLLAMALGVAMIPTGVGKVAGAMAQQR